MSRKVLFVCLGNICRSPIAHGVMEHLAAEQGIDLEVDSAGTAGYHIGEQPDKRSIAICKQHGIDISQQRGRKLKTSDLAYYDHIYVMDRSNFHDVSMLANTTAEMDKIELLLNEETHGKQATVPDPYYGTVHDFEHVFQLVYAACTRLTQKFTGA